MQHRRESCRFLAVSTLLLIALRLISPLLGFVMGKSLLRIAVADVVVTILWMAIVVLMVRSIVGLGLTFWQAAGALVASLAAFAGILAAGLGPLLGNVALIFAASFFGCMVSVIFSEPNILLPVGLVSPFIDYWTVAFGPLSHVIHGTPQVLAKVSAAIPAPGSVGPLAYMGVGDFLCMAMFIPSAERLRMSPDRTAWYILVFAGILMALVVSVDAIGRFGFPGLLAIGLGFVAANRRHFKLSRSEQVMTAGLVALAAAAVLYTGFRGAH